MKATLQFDLNDPDDRMAHLRAVKSENMALVLWEILHNLKRNVTGSNDKSFDDGVDDVIDYIAKDMYEHGININELIR